VKSKIRNVSGGDRIKAQMLIWNYAMKIFTKRCAVSRKKILKALQQYLPLHRRLGTIYKNRYRLTIAADVKYRKK